MKQTKINKEMLSTQPLRGRGAYIAPCIKTILLDNEISLALESEPPEGPDEVFGRLFQPEKFDSNAFHA